MGSRFQCPPDCGHCCTHLTRETPPAEARAAREFRALMRDQGVYACADELRRGLAMSGPEARALRDEAAARGMRIALHPRAWLLETRRRVAVVLEWHLAHASCPFYADYQCTVYDKRPLLCRAYPVFLGAPAWRLAPECPLTPDTQAKAERKEVRLGSFLVTESRARLAVERAHATLDERAWRILEAPGARFAKGLDAVEARARLKRYRVVDAEAWERALHSE